MCETECDHTPNWELDGKVADSIDHEMKMKCNFGMNPMPKCTYSLTSVKKPKKINQIHTYAHKHRTAPNQRRQTD